MGTRAAVLLIVGACLACRSEAMLDGTALSCSNDAHCEGIGDGWRCMESGCVLNSPPQIAPLGRVIIALGETHSATAEVTDPDGDDTVVTWTQLSGPGLPLITTVEDPQLTVTPVDRGLHLFEAVAHDGRATGEPVALTVLVAPPGGAVYVSSAGADGPQCGSVDTPCATVGAGVARATDLGAGTVLLAAAGPAQPYAECLDLSGTVTLDGCHDAGSWIADSTTRALCRIECDDPLGHRLRANATVRNVTLALRPPPGVAPVQTLRITDGAPTVELVDVELGTCAGCAVTGISSFGASATLRGVDVRSGGASVGVMQHLRGALFIGGAPEILGTTDPATGGPRGAVFLDAAASESTYGIVTIEADATVDGVVISGGLSPEVAGLRFFGGDTTARNLDIDLTGSFALTLAGIVRGGCPDPAAVAGSNCDCDTWLTDCSAAPSFARSPGQRTTLADNQLVIGSATTDRGLPPCMALGILAIPAMPGSIVRNNSVTIGDHIVLSHGLSLIESEWSPAMAEPATPTTVSANTIVIGPGTAERGCAAINQSAGPVELARPGDGPAEGAYGLFVNGARRLLVANNTVGVSVHPTDSAGLVTNGTSAAVIRDNTIEVGIASPGAYGELAAGAVLGGTADGVFSTFEGNRVWVSDAPKAAGAPTGGAVQGTAVAIAEAALDNVPKTAGCYSGSQMNETRWEIHNNFMFGGRVPYANGVVACMNVIATEPWPVFVNNTILAGGDPEIGLISRATVWSFPLLDQTLLVNNLLDAGDAGGRRYILDNQLGIVLSPPTMVGNVGQFEGSRPDPVLGRATASYFPLWWIINESAGEVIGLQDSSGAPLELANFSYTGGKPTRVWPIEVDGVDGMALRTHRGLAVVKMFSFLATSDPAPLLAPGAPGPAPEPVDIAAADLDGEGVSNDLIFVTAASGAVGPGAWTLVSDGARGYEPPELGAAYTDPIGVTADVDGRPVWVLDSNVLQRYPSSDMSTAMVFPAGLGGPVTDVRFANLNASTTDAELIAVAGGTVHVWLNVNQSVQGQSLGAQLPYDIDPCAMSMGNFAFYEVGELAPGIEGSELLVVCDDDSLETYHLASGQMRQNTRWTLGAGGPIKAASVGRSLLPLERGRVLVVRAPADPIEAWTIDNSGVATLMYAFKPLADVAMMDTVRVRQDDFTVPGITRNPMGMPPTCPLAARGPGMGPLDFHLAPGPNGCVDAGVDTCTGAGPSGCLTADIDGPATRTDMMNDIGADER